MNRSTLVYILLCSGLAAQGAPPTSTGNASAQAAAPAKLAAARSRYRPDRFAGRARTYYRLVWGIDYLSVKWAEQGEVIRFSYQVLDAAKAKTLNDKKLEPSLVDERAHVKLVVPMVDKVGLLRQTSDPEVRRTYWMLFSNSGGHVQRGDRVSIVIGNFRADGLVVD